MSVHNSYTRIFVVLLAFFFIAPCFTVSIYADSDVPAEYAALYPIPEKQAQSAPIMQGSAEFQDTVLNGASILFVGDSLTSGYGFDDYADTWTGMLETKYGMDVTCNSIAGSTFGTAAKEGYAPGYCYRPICKRDLPEGDFDVIFVEGGSNDWYCEIPLGTDKSSRDASTFMGGVNVTLDRIQAAYPDALILCMTAWETPGDRNGNGVTSQVYAEAFLDICTDRNVPCYPALDASISGIAASDPAFRKQYFLSVYDPWHFNAAGHVMFLPIIADWMATEYGKQTIAGFEDVCRSDWYADAVEYTASKGLFNGTSLTTFSPELEMNRAMLITVLYRAAGSPDVSGLTTPFEDLDAESYYFDAVVWGYNTGVINGISASEFAPDAPITREQLAAMLFRNKKAAAPSDRSVLSAFSDSSNISPYAQDAMCWAISNQVVKGMGDGTLCPQDSATRAQTAQMLTNYYQLK